MTKEKHDPLTYTLLDLSADFAPVDFPAVSSQLQDNALFKWPVTLEFKGLFGWFLAIHAYEMNELEPLGKLLADDTVEIPNEIRLYLSQIVLGNKKPNKKAAVKLRIPARLRMIVGLYLVKLEMKCEYFRKHYKDPDFPDNRPGLDTIADKIGKEPAQVDAEISAISRQFIKDLSEIFSVSIDTIEELRGLFKENIERYGFTGNKPDL